MATQNFETDSIIFKITPRILTNNLVYSHCVRNDLRSDFSFKVGNTINFRYAQRGTSQANNPVLNPTGINQTSLPVTVDQTQTASFMVSNYDLTLSAQQLSALVIAPAIEAMAQNIDQSLANLTMMFPNKIGLAGASSGDLLIKYIAQAKQYLTQACAPPTQRYGAMDPAGVVQLNVSSTGAVINYFQPSVIMDILMENALGRYMGIDFFESNNAPYFTAGTSVAANLTITQNTVAGDTFLYLLDSGNGYLYAGDVIELSVSGSTPTINAVGPMTQSSLGRPRQLVIGVPGVDTPGVTKYQLNSSTGTKVPVYDGSPNYGGFQITAGNGVWVTVTALPTTSSTVSRIWYGGQESAVFHKEAIALVMVAPEVMPGAPECRVVNSKGFPILITQGYDIIGHNSYWRADALYKNAMIRPDFGVRICHD